MLVNAGATKYASATVIKLARYSDPSHDSHGNRETLSASIIMHCIKDF